MTPVIPALREAEAERTQIQGQTLQVSETLSQNKHKERPRDVAKW